MQACISALGCGIRGAVLKFLLDLSTVMNCNLECKLRPTPFIPRLPFDRLVPPPQQKWNQGIGHEEILSQRRQAVWALLIWELTVCWIFVSLSYTVLGTECDFLNMLYRCSQISWASDTWLWYLTCSLPCLHFSRYFNSTKRWVLFWFLFFNRRPITELQISIHKTWKNKRTMNIIPLRDHNISFS